MCVGISAGCTIDTSTAQSALTERNAIRHCLHKNSYCVNGLTRPQLLAVQPAESARTVNVWAADLNRSARSGLLMVMFSLEQATKAQRGSRGIALLFL